ncbi:hypothetical protein KI387_002674, partial [Taxus chinensis]
ICGLKGLPHGFQALPSLHQLPQKNLSLSTLLCEFENMVSLLHLDITTCPILDGAKMERIVNLQKCSFVYMGSSIKLMECWEEKRKEEQNLLVVRSSRDKHDLGREQDRTLRVALLGGAYIELDSSRDELIEHSSLLAHNNTTLLFIVLSVHIKQQY